MSSDLEVRHPIGAKVAKVIGPREVILNRGSEQGITRGMKFAILDRRAEHVTDPETGEDLGSLITVKVRVQIIIVQARLSLAKTFEIESYGGGIGIGGVANLFAPPQTRYVTFNPKPGEETFHPETSIVQRGDEAIELVERTEESKSSAEIKK